MGELKMSGNCLKASRPILSFSSDFGREPHLKILKELLVQTFSTPSYHPRSQPFIDHVFSFCVSSDKKIWFRNYQIVQETDGKLEEIGPRMVLELIGIFEGSFGGQLLFENPDYINPNVYRRQVKMAGAKKYIGRVEAQKSLEVRRSKLKLDDDPLHAVFDTTASLKRRMHESDSDDEESSDMNKLTQEALFLKKQLEKKKPSRKRKKRRIAQS